MDTKQLREAASKIFAVPEDQVTAEQLAEAKVATFGFRWGGTVIAGPTRGATHALKTWPASFEAVWTKHKTHEVRKNDRDYQVWDTLILQEWDPDTEVYSGRTLRVLITFITPGGSFGLPSDLCVMSITQEGNR